MLDFSNGLLEMIYALEPVAKDLGQISAQIHPADGKNNACELFRSEPIGTTPETVIGIAPLQGQQQQQSDQIILPKSQPRQFTPAQADFTTVPTSSIVNNDEIQQRHENRPTLVQSDQTDDFLHLNTSASDERQGKFANTQQENIIATQNANNNQNYSPQNKFSASQRLKQPHNQNMIIEHSQRLQPKELLHCPRDFVFVRPASKRIIFDTDYIIQQPGKSVQTDKKTIQKLFSQQRSEDKAAQQNEFLQSLSMQNITNQQQQNSYIQQEQQQQLSQQQNIPVNNTINASIQSPQPVSPSILQLKEQIQQTEKLKQQISQRSSSFSNQQQNIQYQQYYNLQNLFNNVSGFTNSTNSKISNSGDGPLAIWQVQGRQNADDIKAPISTQKQDIQQQSEKKSVTEDKAELKIQNEVVIHQSSELQQKELTQQSQTSLENTQKKEKANDQAPSIQNKGQEVAEQQVKPTETKSTTKRAASSKQKKIKGSNSSATSIRSRKSYMSNGSQQKVDVDALL